LADVSPSGPWGRLDRLVASAEALAGAWGARARASTTIGRERAILRLFGVDGLDATGRPLAGATVDRWLASEPRSLGSGITLPFAMALLEYDVEPQQLALDVASGAVDLSLEAELLRDRDRRVVAEAEAIRLATAALERIDAQRTVRLETFAVLGDAGRPWLGATLAEPALEEALEEAAILLDAGFDFLRVEVPINREQVDRLTRAGRDVPEWPPRDRPGREAFDMTPAGSQRALAILRSTLDEAAAERRAYVRLATVTPALGAPESAFVAAFERVDMTRSDLMAEIVTDAVEPDRALADHAFAHQLIRRAGTVLLAGSGPLVVAPDLAAGIPSDPATRAGRALALQLLGITLARGDGLPPDQIVVGALPSWLTDEPSPAARAVAEVAVRRALYPEHRFGFVEPPVAPDRSIGWVFVQAAAAVRAGDVALVLRRPGPGREDAAATVAFARAAASVAADVAASTVEASLTGTALEHARGMVDAAIDTLDRLANDGWRTVAGDPPDEARARSWGTETVAERTDDFDPFGWEPDRAG
jgi:hypothetical protein